MEFGLSPQTTLMQESLEKTLQRDADLDRVLKLVDDDQTRDPQLLGSLVDMGIPSLLIPEQHGGIGLDLLDAAIVSQVLGSFAAPAPFIASSVMVPRAIKWNG